MARAALPDSATPSPWSVRQLPKGSIFSQGGCEQYRTSVGVDQDHAIQIRMRATVRADRRRKGHNAHCRLREDVARIPDSVQYSGPAYLPSPAPAAQGRSKVVLPQTFHGSAVSTMGSYHRQAGQLRDRQASDYAGCRTLAKLISRQPGRGYAPTHRHARTGDAGFKSSGHV